MATLEMRRWRGPNRQLRTLGEWGACASANAYAASHAYPRHWQPEAQSHTDDWWGSLAREVSRGRTQQTRE